jgi:hypothetical protein
MSASAWTGKARFHVPNRRAWPSPRSASPRPVGIPLRPLMSGCLSFPAKPSALRQCAGPSLLPQRLAVVDCPRRDRFDARIRSRARTCAGVAPSLDHHEPNSLTLSGYKEFVRERARVLGESYGPGFCYRTPLSPLGAYLCLSPTRVRIRYFLREQRSQKHPVEASAPACQRMPDGLRNSNMRATGSHTAAVRVGRLICAKRSDWCILN